MKQGFSLIELLLVLTLIGIISTISIRGAQQLLAKRSHQNAIHLLKSSLYNVQSNSQNTGFTTIICPSVNARQCRSDADWSTGWISYQDKDNDKTLDSDESIGLSHRLTAGDIAIKFNAADSGKKIVFYPNGRLWPNGNFVICHTKLTNRHKITTYANGRIRNEINNTSDCE